VILTEKRKKHAPKEYSQKERKQAREEKNLKKKRSVLGNIAYSKRRPWDLSRRTRGQEGSTYGTNKAQGKIGDGSEAAGTPTPL